MPVFFQKRKIQSKLIRQILKNQNNVFFYFRTQPISLSRSQNQFCKCIIMEKIKEDSEETTIVIFFFPTLLTELCVYLV